MVNNALNDFNRAIELNRLNPLGWEQRGEVSTVMGEVMDIFKHIPRVLNRLIRRPEGFNPAQGKIIWH